MWKHAWRVWPKALESAGFEGDWIRVLFHPAQRQKPDIVHLPAHPMTSKSILTVWWKIYKISIKLLLSGSSKGAGLCDSQGDSQVLGWAGRREERREVVRRCQTNLLSCSELISLDPQHSGTQLVAADWKILKENIYCARHQQPGKLLPEEFSD